MAPSGGKSRGLNEYCCRARIRHAERPDSSSRDGAIDQDNREHQCKCNTETSEQREVNEVIMMVQSYENLRYFSEFALTNTEIASVYVNTELVGRSVFACAFVQGFVWH